MPEEHERLERNQQAAPMRRRQRGRVATVCKTVASGLVGSNPTRRTKQWAEDDYSFGRAHPKPRG